jgi:hypothetical protein
MDAAREGLAASSDALAWVVRIAQLHAPIVESILTTGSAIWSAESICRGRTAPIAGDPGGTTNLTRWAICLAAAGKWRLDFSRVDVIGTARGIFTKVGPRGVTVGT